MKPAAHPYQSEKSVSELATLSRDPALASRPDPAFRVKFRNPDETLDGDYNGWGSDTHSPLTHRTGLQVTPSLRRSQKE